jgi:hypothetical protein
MVLTIAALDTAGKVDNWILGRADLRLSFLSGICSQFPVGFGRMRTHSVRADGDDGDGDSDGNGDGDGDVMVPKALS